MNQKVSVSSLVVIGVMLFALFFGAGNLIFPAQLGQNAGSNMWPASIGFLITGVGLPLLGILAIGFSGSSNLQELATRIDKRYAVFFTSLLYLTIGPFFAIPRTGTVSFEIGMTNMISESNSSFMLLIFTAVYFAITLWLCLNPAKIVDRVGKYLAPGIVILLVLLLILAIIKPMGSFSSPQGDYVSSPFTKGFIEGYNTMDALASLVFAIIVINAIKGLGITNKKQILTATIKSGVIAVSLLGLIYVGITYLGATTVEKFGFFETGGPVLISATNYYFGTFGSIILAILILLACLTTCIGLITACSEYFNTLMPKISYRQFVVIFTVISFIIANFGLANIISFSIPVLMFLYPLAISIMLLAFVSPIFYHSRIVYVATTFVTLLISIVDGLVALCSSLSIDQFQWLKPIVNFYENTLPLYSQGLGWLVPVLVTMLLTTIVVRVFKLIPVESPNTSDI